MYIMACTALIILQVNYSNTAIMKDESEERFRFG